MTYKEYVKKKFEEALTKEHFDPDGNSVTATCNRGFFKQLIHNIGNVNEGFIEVIQNWRMLVLPAYFSKRRAKKEMMQSYIDSKIDRMHE